MRDRWARSATCNALIAGLSGLAFVSLVHAAHSLAVERGWQPVVALAGARDPVRAIRTLREITRLCGIALRAREVDAVTSDFLERAGSALEDFNLKKLYELLPEKDGRFHQLSVAGGFAGARYKLGQSKDRKSLVGPEGSRQQVGEVSLVLRAAPVATSDSDTNYLMQGRGGIVVGPIAWAMVIDGAQQVLRLLSNGGEAHGARPMVASRQTVLARNPRLGAEDVEPIATLWEAFPRLANLLSALGGVDDLVAGPVPAAPGVKRVRAALHVAPERMKDRYPKLAAYMRGLDKLLEADLRWLDAHERTFATAHLSSKDLSTRIELYVKDGLLVPSRGDAVLADQPLQAGLGVFPYSVRASANFRLLGVSSQLRKARADFAHERTERGMELRAVVKQVPVVTVDGAALGILPTGVIDMFIPGNIQSLIEQSLATACHGNGGKGVTLDVRYDQRPGGNATLDGAITLEAIDNFLVKLGAGFLTDRMLPDDGVRENISQLLRDLQAAFSADLERYAKPYSAQL